MILFSQKLKIIMRLGKLRIKLLEHCVLIGVCIWFILILSWKINIPLNSADEVRPAIQIQRFLNNKSVTEHSNIILFGKYFPVTTDGKHGAAEVYLLMPFMFFGGNTIEALRLGYIFIVVLIIFFLYYFCTEFFNASVAKLSILFLALNDSFFHYFSQGTTFGLTLPLFTVISLIFMFKWHKMRNNIYLYLGLFSLSIGFQAKGWFIWFIVALFITSLLLYAPIRRIRLKTKIFCIAIFMLSLLPLLCYYYLTNFNKFIISYTVVSQSGVSNLNILKNFILRFEHFNNLIGGIFDLGKISWGFSLFIFWFCFIYLCLNVFLDRKLAFSKNRVTFILLLFIFTLLMSCFTFTNYKEGHLLILFPFIQIIMSIGIFSVWKNREISKSIIICIFSLFFIINLSRYLLWHYRSFGYERGNYSCCNIKSLTHWLLENKICKANIFNWTVACGVEFFGDTKIDANVTRYIEPYNPDDFMVKNAKFKEVFVFTFPDDQNKLLNFELLCYKTNRRVVLLKEYYCRDDIKWLAVYSLQ